MPTGGSARFNSALNVRHFLKYQPFINLSKKEVLSVIDEVILVVGCRRIAFIQSGD